MRNILQRKALPITCKKKQVGAHGIRFRSSKKYGNVAVVPMRDIYGMIWSYQILNVDGSKIFCKNGRTKNVFHALGKPADGSIIGLAESYVTSATCFEVTSIPTICAFSCTNMLEVANTIRARFPNSQIVVFADNDRHLKDNIGVATAKEICRELKSNCVYIYPEFSEANVGKGTSDWNDLIRLEGKGELTKQIGKIL